MKNENSDYQSAEANTENKMYSVQVWDIPTRLFHWILVGLVIFSFITGKIGLSAMRYHEWSGVAILVLVVFRLLWGFLGGRYSRFSNFIKSPAAVIRYALSLPGEDSKPYIGHNPLGGWSIIAMLTSLLVQAGTGLFANDDILTEGPLYAMVSKQTSDWLTGVHHLNQKVLLVLVLIHIAAVLFYLIVKRENLIKPMITGNKTWDQNIPAAWGNPALAILVAAAVAAAAYVIIY